MLVLSRKLNEEIVIGRTIRIKLLKTGRGRVRLGVSAPRDTPIERAEVIDAKSCEHNAHYGQSSYEMCEMLVDQ